MYFSCLAHLLIAAAVLVVHLAVVIQGYCFRFRYVQSELPVDFIFPYVYKDSAFLQHGIIPLSSLVQINKLHSLPLLLVLCCGKCNCSPFIAADCCNLYP